MRKFASALQLFLAVGSVAVLNACGSQTGSENTKSDPKIVIGENDLQYYTKDDRISNAIGKMALGCTVTHIGNGFALTAGHCVQASTCNDSAHEVTWGYTLNRREGQLRSKCVEIVEKEFNNRIDYAVLRYEPAPSSSLTINTSYRPKKTDRLTIFSHPNGIPLSWSGFCKHEGDMGGSKFSYGCDTMGGSSGAAILNEDFEIVGVHNLGSYYYGFNGGTYLQDIPAFK